MSQRAGAGRSWRAIGSLSRNVPAELNRIAGWLYVIAAVWVTVSVIARKLSTFSAGPTVEISSYVLAIGISISLSGTLLSRGHIRVDAVVMMLPRPLRIVFHLLALVGLGIPVALLGIRAWETTLESLHRHTIDQSSWSIPVGIPQVIWASGIVLLFVTVVGLLGRCVFLVIRRRPEEVEQLLASDHGSEVKGAVDLIAQELGVPPGTPHEDEERAAHEDAAGKDDGAAHEDEGDAARASEDDERGEKQ